MISAKWDLTSTCNLRCKHCSVAEMYFTNTIHPQLSLNDRLRIIDRLSDGGVKYLSLLGGEPLTLGDDLFSLLSRAKKRDIRVGIVTNGQLLTYDISKRLIDYGIANLTVSIESPSAEIHNKIRGKKTFERLLVNIEDFLKVRGNQSSPEVAVNTVLCRPNRDTFTQMIPFCRDLGVDSWSALTLNYIGNATHNIDNLALSDEEHTEVAVEIGRFLKTPGFNLGNLKLNITIVCPLVWEYVSKKYDIQLPQPEICCSAGISLFYLSPTGEMHLCDRVNSSGYTGSKLETDTMRPMSLLTNSFEEVWNSAQYMEMFSFIKLAKTYANFEPCNHCKYLSDRTCNPCPLQSYRSETIKFDECLKAENYLGNISQYDDKPRTTWEQLHQFKSQTLPRFETESYENVRYMYPCQTLGTRYMEHTADEALLMHPRSAELIKINALGCEIWKSFTGTVTTDEIVAEAGDLYKEVGLAFNRYADTEEIKDFEKEYVIPFIMSLYEKGFLEFERIGHEARVRSASDLCLGSVTT
jgi:radical SAM protein with 4Fe4S-binding SPASM domain